MDNDKSSQEYIQRSSDSSGLHIIRLRDVSPDNSKSRPQCRIKCIRGPRGKQGPPGPAGRLISCTAKLRDIFPCSDSSVISFHSSINIDNNINLPPTNSTGTAGVLTIDNIPFLQDSGNNNIYLGKNAGNFSSTPINCIGIGSNSLQSNTTGTSCIGIGVDSLQSNISGGDCIGIGGDSLQYTTAGPNIGIGTGALQNNTTGIDNIGIGFNALVGGVSGGRNVAIGSSALSRTNNINNVGIGYATLMNNSSGLSNIGVGSGSLFSNLTGSDNTGIGINALNRLTSGNFNVAIGNNAGINLRTSESNNIYLANFGVNGEDNTMRLGTNTVISASYIAGIYGTSLTASPAPVYIDINGQLGSINASSHKYKQNINSINNITEKINKLRPVTFNYIGQPGIEYGLIAEEVQEIFPDCVETVDGQPEGVKYHNFTALLLAGLQSQIAENIRLNDKVDKLTQLVNNLIGS